MLALTLLPVALALLVLGAHFLHAGAQAGVAVAVVLVALLFLRRPAAARVVQLALVLGALEWVRTLAALVAERQSAGAPYVRLAIILGGVAAATALCLLAFRAARVRRHFRLPASE